MTKKHTVAVVTVAGIAMIGIALAIVFKNGTANNRSINVIGEDSSSLQAMEAQKGEFESRSGIIVNFIKLPFDVALEKSNHDLSLGTGQYDIVCQYGASLAPYVNKKYVLLLDEMERVVPSSSISRDFEKDFFPKLWRETGYFKPFWSGNVERVSYPFAATTMLLVYRKSMFESNSAKELFQRQHQRQLIPPTTWEDFAAAARFFTDPAAKSYGVVLEGAPGGFLYWGWCNFAFGMGGGVAKKQNGWEGDVNTPFILNSPETVAATEFYLALKPSNFGDYLSVGSAEQRELFLNNRVAMAIMWTDYIPDLLKNSKASDFGFAPIPGNVSMLGGATFFVNRHSTKQREAIEYILSLMNTKAQVAMMKHGIGSPMRSPYEDPEVRQIAYVPALRDSLERGVYMIEAGPDSQLIQDGITETIQQLWTQGGSVKSKLQELQERVEKERQNLFEHLGP